MADRSLSRSLAMLVALTIAVSAAGVCAQETPTTLRAADEATLVRYAFEHNPDLAAARSNVAIAAANITSAAAVANPVARGEWLHVQSPADYGWGVGLGWTPPQPGVYGAHRAAAQASWQATGNDLAESAADLERDVRSACAVLQALDQELALAERSIQTREQVRAAVAARVSHGAASRIDLSLAAVSLAREEQQRDSLSLARAAELVSLANLLGLPPNVTLDVRLPVLTSLGAEAVNPGAESGLVQRALSERPALRGDLARVEAADQSLSAERAKRWPWIELEARYRRRDQSTFPDDVTLGVELTLPIANQNAGPIAAAEASQHKLRQAASAHRASVEREVRALVAESARRSALAARYAEAITPLLQEHVQLVKQALQGMELDLTALLAAEDMVTRGAIEYEEARLAQRKIEIALARALGSYGRLPARGGP